MAEEEKKIPDDIKKELLKKTDEDGYHDIDAIKAKLEGKIPTEPKDEDE